MEDLEKAISIALETHYNQKDKAGDHYILHPLRVMLKFSTDRERIVAILHDVIEDGDVEIMDLKLNGFSDEITNAIDCLTRRKNETYETFINRVSMNDLAKAIKIQDLQDNLNLTRLTSLSDRDVARLGKYHRALLTLTCK